MTNIRLMAAAILITAIAWSARAPAPPAPFSESVPVQTGPFLIKLYMANRLEIKAASLAKRNAVSTTVRRYADRLWRDHRLAENEIYALSQKLGIELGGAAPGHGYLQTMVKRPTYFQDQVFDRAYVQATLQNEQKIQRLLESVPETQANLSSLASKLVPIFRQDMDLARGLALCGYPVKSCRQTRRGGA